MFDRENEQSKADAQHGNTPSRELELAREFEDLFYEAFCEDRVPPEGQTLQERCQKYAQIAVTNLVICKRCEGNGTLRIPGGIRECPDCKGTGIDHAATAVAGCLTHE